MMDLECPALQPPRLFFCPPKKIVVLPNQGGFTKRFSTDHALTFVGTFCHQKTFQVGGCFLGAFLCEHLNQGITSSFSTFKGGCQLKLIHGLPSGTVFKYANHTPLGPYGFVLYHFFEKNDSCLVKTPVRTGDPSRRLMPFFQTYPTFLTWSWLTSSL